MHDPARILIVDDNPTNRDILLTRLAMHGYDLSQAADGEEAVAAVKTLVPDLVLLEGTSKNSDRREFVRV
jgi:CheY-like chemotaxis protein